MNKEQVYDAEIDPLMTQIIAICKKHKIAMLASFSIPTEEDNALACTSLLATEEYEPPQPFLDAARIICDEGKTPVFIYTRDADGKIIKSEAVL